MVIQNIPNECLQHKRWLVWGYIGIKLVQSIFISVIFYYIKAVRQIFQIFFIHSLTMLFGYDLIKNEYIFIQSGYFATSSGNLLCPWILCP